MAHDEVRFLKPADRDPRATVELDEVQVQHVLFVACDDLGRVAGGKPVELQVYEAWWLAVTTKEVTKVALKAQPIIRQCIKLFPGIRSVDLAGKKQLGQQERIG